MDFYDPAVKLKTQRLSGIVLELSDGGVMAKVNVENTGRHITMKCALLRHRGEYNEVSTVVIRNNLLCWLSIGVEENEC